MKSYDKVKYGPKVSNAETVYGLGTEGKTCYGEGADLFLFLSLTRVSRD